MTGTAGGFHAKGGIVGDVYISSEFKHHDRRIAIPGFTEYGIGNHPATPVPNLVQHFGYKTGVVSTGNSLDHTPKDLELMAANDASVKEMEAAAIAWTTEQLGVPFFAVKVITDIVDGGRPSHEEFMENLETAAKSLQDALPKIVTFVAGKRLSDL